MRRLLSALSVVTAVPVLLAVPVASRPAPAAHPVGVHTTTLSLRPTGAGQSAAADTGERRTGKFDLVGATWRAGTLHTGDTVQVRVHQNGGWSGWSALEAPDGGPDRGTADAARAGHVVAGTTAAEPLWVGAADGVQARVINLAGASRSAPADVKVVLVDGGTSSADAHPGPATPVGGSVAEAAATQPTIYTRAQWGADESLRVRACGSGASYGSTISMGFVHHTDNANGYTQSQVPSIIRSIYAYHVNSNGWCDIGYSFLVDRFGRIWEGRYGGITKPVIGAHTGGFNTNTFAASLIGNFGSTAPSAAMLSAVENLFAWKLGAYYLDPSGKTTVTAGSFSGSRYSTGQRVTFNTISGHRDADFTSCPGNAAYADLPAIRTAVRKLMGTGFIAPSSSTTTAKMAAGSVTVTAGAVTALNWSLQVQDASGAVLRTLTGAADRTTPVTAKWDLTDATATAVPPGVYTLTLTGGNSAGQTANPYRTTVTVTPPVTLTVPARVTYTGLVTPSGTGRPSRTVSVSYKANGTVHDLGVQTVGADGRWSLPSSKVPADHDISWSVTDPVTAYVAKRLTKVRPTLVSPSSTALVRAGNALTVTGTALPDAANVVTLLARPAGTTSTSTVTSSPVATSGSWKTSFTPTSPTTFWVRDSRGLVSSTQFVYPVDAAAATAPGSAYAGRSVRVTGNAGHAPAPVTLQSRVGSASYTTVATTTAAAGGHFALRLPVPKSAGSTLSWRITTGYSPAVTGTLSILATFPPTVAGPRAVHWNATRQLTGIAVPGDLVTIWTRPVGTSAWVQAGSTRTGSDKNWAFPLTFTRDVEWRATSATGTSSTGRTVITPSIYAPSSVPAGTLAVLHGTAVPGSTLTLYRSPAGATTWAAVRTMTVATDGRWTIRRRPTTTVRFRVTSAGQTSRTVTITTT